MKRLVFADRLIVSSKKPEIFTATVIFIVSVILVALALGLNAERGGDGHYYFADVKALVENYSTAITETIRAEVSARCGELYWTEEARAANGLNYSVHFFAYSLAAVPAYKILQVFAMDTLKAFQLTNAFIEIALLCYLLLYCKSSAFVRWAVAALFLLSTGSIYFQFTGPEVFTAALVLAASMGFVERRYAQAAMLTAAASLQNPSAVFLLVPIGLGLTSELLSEFHQSGLSQRFAGRIVGLVVAGLLVALPYAWNYGKFSVFNPIVAEGALDYSLISLNRLNSLFFDLNQGVIVGLPCLILAIPAALLTKLIARIRFGKSFFRAEDWLLIGVILMSIPLLAQRNWNSAQIVFIRYATWLAMPFVVWIAVTLNQVSVGCRQLIMISALGAQLATVLVNGQDPESYVRFKPWVPALWAAAPRIYNPVPEIFFERTAGQEAAAIRTPAFYSPPGSGSFLKILTKSDNLDEASKKLCGGQGQLRPESYKSGSGPYITRVEKGYFYISGHLRCTYSLPFELPFASTDNTRLEMSGWSTPELNGTWNDGDRASIRIPLDPAPAGDVRVTLSGTAFVNGRLSKQLIKINAGGQEIDSWTTEFPQQQIAREFIVKNDKIGKNALLTLDFLFPNATSPAKLGFSGDSRQLSMALHSIRVDNLDEASKELCGGQGQLRYFYISGHLRCTYSLPFELPFASTDNTRLEMSGWSTPELNGTWNDGGRATIQIPLDPAPAGDVRVTLSGTAFVNERLSKQLIKINAGGQEIDSWTTEFPQQQIAREFIVKNDKIDKNALLTLDFLFPNATSPAKLGFSGDSRQLSMALHSIRVDNLDEASKELCGGQGQLRYFYISGHLRCTHSLPFELSFTSTDNTRLEMSGWSTPELNGTWNDGGRATIQIPLDPAPAGDVRVTLSGTAFVNERLSKQLIKINAGGQEIDSWTTEFPQQQIAREFIVKNDKIDKNALLTLDFLFPNATSPAKLGFSGDSRQLSMALHSIRVDPM